MEVRIGVKGALRELSIDTTLSAEELEAAVAASLKDGAATLTLSDDKGRRLIIASEKLVYVEITESEGRRVGFGAV